MSARFSIATLALVLVATVAMGQGRGPGPGGPPDAAPAVVARSLMDRAETSPDDDVVGRIEVLASNGHERLRITVCRLDPEAEVSATMDDGSGGTLDLGEIEADAVGRAVFEWDTGMGDELPGGVSAIADLAGREVKIHDDEDALLLSGEVPSLEDDLRQPWKAKAKVKARAQNQNQNQNQVGPAASCEVKMKVRVRTRQRERLKLKVKGLRANEECELWVEDEETGQMRLALRLRANHRGRVKTKLRAEGDEDLVPGCGGASDLAGMRWEIRNRNQVCVASGQMPTP